MTYQDAETSVRGGKPIELYKFVGTYENYYYTTAVRKIAFDDGDGSGSHDYIPVPMQRSEIAAGTEQDDGLNITIDLPVTAGLISVYAFESAPPELNLTIYRYHDPANVVAYWIGSVAQIQTNDGIGTVQSNSQLATILADDFPNVYYQAPCNNKLFDTRCKVVEANFSGTAVLGVVNGKSITVDAIPHGATAIALTGKLIGGEVMLSSGERRMITSQAGVIIGVNFPFSQTTIGDVVTITAGCDLGYLGDCKTKFANQKNFGGFPFIGTDNPFTDGLDQGQVLPDGTCLPPHFEGWFWELIFTVDRMDTTPTPQNHFNSNVLASSAVWSNDGRVGNWQWRHRTTVDLASGSTFGFLAQFGADFHDGEDSPGGCFLDGDAAHCAYLYARHWDQSTGTNVLGPGFAIGRLFPFEWDGLILP